MSRSLISSLTLNDFVSGGFAFLIGLVTECWEFHDEGLEKMDEADDLWGAELEREVEDVEDAEFFLGMDIEEGIIKRSATKYDWFV